MSGFEWLSFIGGLFAAVIGTIIKNEIYKSELEIDDNTLKVTSSAELSVLTENDGITAQGSQIVGVIVYRIKVKNKGKIAAKNVCGTIEFDDNQPERRICWYEGNIGSITINKDDHSYLDIYGVILEGNQITNKICIPTENGWKGLNKITVSSEWNLKIRVTAENAGLKRKEFKINPQNRCELEFV